MKLALNKQLMRLLEFGRTTRMPLTLGILAFLSSFLFFALRYAPEKSTSEYGNIRPDEAISAHYFLAFVISIPISAVFLTLGFGLMMSLRGDCRDGREDSE